MINDKAFYAIFGEDFTKIYVNNVLILSLNYAIELNKSTVSTILNLLILS